MRPMNSETADVMASRARVSISETPSNFQAILKGSTETAAWTWLLTADKTATSFWPPLGKTSSF